MSSKSKNNCYYIKNSKVSRTIDINQPIFGKISSRGKTRDSSRKRQSAVDITVNSDTQGGNKLGEYAAKTIPSKHKSHKSMSCISANKTNDIAISKTIDDNRYYPKPIVSAKKKAKMYYYGKKKTK